MLRILWASSEFDSTNSQQVTLKRTEGGWWYSEETAEDGQDRKAWKVHSRFPCESGFCEVLTALPEDWIQQPCWQDEPPQQIQILREQGQISLQQLVTGSAQKSLLSLWLPLALQEEQKPWPQWVQEVLGPLRHSVAQLVAQTNMISSLDQGPVVPLLQKQPSLEPKAERPLQTLAQRQVSHDKPHPRHVSQGDRNKPSQGRQGQSSVSVAPKGLQTGSLLTPVDLPTGQLPRNSNGHRPAHRGQPGRDRRPQPPVCLLVEE